MRRPTLARRFPNWRRVLVLCLVVPALVSWTVVAVLVWVLPRMPWPACID